MRIPDYFEMRISGRFDANRHKVSLTHVPSITVRPLYIVEAPVAFECVISEKLETASRHIFIGEVKWLHARNDLIDVERYRVHL